MLVNEDEYFRGQVEGDILYGVEGPPGPAGKNAYEYAKENGYTGSESGFSRLLGQFPERVDTAVQKAETAAEEAYKAIEALDKADDSIVETSSGEVISLTDCAERPLRGLKVFGKTTQNGTPTPEVPAALDSVGDDGSIGVTVCGKNLVNFPNTESYVNNGITWSCKDGVVHAKGTSTATSSTGSLSVDIAGLAGTFTRSGSASYANLLCMVTKNGQTEWVGNTFTLDGSESTVLLYFQCAANVTLDIDLYPMLNVGEAALPYEPYKYGGSLTISTPNGLPGIPVTSGGNYTDGNGQQWVCDELDFEKGVYVQRVGKSTLNKENTWYWNASKNCAYCSIPNAIKLDNTNQTERLVSGDKYVGTSWVRLGQADAEYHCSMYYGLSFVAIHDKDCASVDEFLAKLGDNTIEVQYMLATPIETALSAEQLAAFAALHTNYPNTTVFNEEGAGMEVKYVADTKLYIDKKFDQLAAAMLNN